MTLIIVTILDGKGGSTKLGLPGDIPIAELGLEISQKVSHPDRQIDKIPFKAVLMIDSNDEVIPSHESLEDAGIGDGEVLRLLLRPIPQVFIDVEAFLYFNGPGFIHPGGKTFPFRGSNILIGRVDRSTGVVTNVLGVNLTGMDDIEEPTVSRRHAQVLFRDGEYLLQDLNSTNGTIVNGRLLAPEMRCPLDHGDEIRFGDVILYFIWDGQQVNTSTT